MFFSKSSQRVIMSMYVVKKFRTVCTKHFVQVLHHIYYVKVIHQAVKGFLYLNWADDDTNISSFYDLTDI